MKVPIIWLKDYISINKSPQQIADAFTAIGLMLDKPIENNVLDLEHRMDRSDWLSIIGCARGLAAYEGLKLKHPKRNIKKPKLATKDTLVPITVRAKKVVNRFNTRVFKGVKIKDSPQWLKERLESYGIPAKNNIVDITNFVMVEYGQPMHAQDLAKFDKREIVIRYAKPGEKITTLLGETATLDKSAFVLTQNDVAIVIGGVVGGETTGVTRDTTEIILDAGNYDQRSVRATSRNLKIQNESVARYDKFLDPRLTEVAIERATQLILDLAGGECYENIDWYPKPVKPTIMTLRLERLVKLSGMDTTLQEAANILKRLEYQVTSQSQKSLTVEIPYFRTDVVVEDDLVADILRINDYANIPATPIHAAPPRETTPPLYLFEQHLKDTLTNLGLHEHITDPLVEKSGRPGEVVLENALTKEKSALRINIAQTLMPVLTTYEKHNIVVPGIFEIGLTYHKKGRGKAFENYQEKRRLTIICDNPDRSPHQNSKYLRSILASLMLSLGIDNYRIEKDGYEATIMLGKEQLGTLTHNTITLETLRIFKHTSTTERVLSDFTNYQSIDLSLSLKKDRPFGPIYQAIRTFSKDIVSVEVIDEYTGNKIDKGTKSVLVRLTLKNKTNLKKLHKSLTKMLTTMFKITLRLEN